MRLVPLGTNGYIPTHGRQTMCFLVRAGDLAILLDAGSGVARLLEPEIRALLDGVEVLDLVLSHYHLDHVIGVSYLPGVWPDKPVRIWAPAVPLVEADPAEALCRLVHPPLFPVSLPELPMRVEVERIVGESFVLDGLEVRVRPQEHPGGSIGIRLGDALTYVTDTVPDTATAELAAGTDLLLHEVWKGGDGQAAHGHSTAEKVARLAERSGVRRLMPIHHNPQHTARDLEELAAELARGTSAEVLLPEEGKVYEVPDQGLGG